MEINEIQEKEVWENFLLNCSEKTFLNSWNWGEFQKREGNKIWRLGFFEGDKLNSVALVLKIKAKRGTFLFVPHGPNVPEENKEKSKEILKSLVTKLKEVAKDEKAHFIRISPIWKRTPENKEIFKSLGFREAPIHMHPEVTWELDISPSEEDILMGMRKTTRYLIRKAKKDKDIKVETTTDIKKLPDFYKIYCATAKRHHFVPFPEHYVRNQFLSFLPDNQILLFFGKYKEHLVSTAIIVFWQKVGFYHYGASLSKFNKFPVSYLVQWEAIREAKKRGCLLYNFWGIAPGINTPQDLKKSKHPWAGLSLFKMGFGGQIKRYVKTQDLPLSSFYWLTFVFEKIRKFKRGL